MAKPGLPEHRYCPRCGGGVEMRPTEGRERPVCSRCGHIVYINPIPAAAVVLIDRGRVLLTLRDVAPKKGEWCLPGGFVEWGEGAADAAARELLEETGICAGELSLVGVYDSVTGPRLHVLVVAFRALSWTGEPRPGDDAADVAWFSVDSAPDLAFDVHTTALAETLEILRRESSGD